ncbi:hypothetical protein [Marinobacter alexandrii]|jgi:hypothetical protein|uniref:hypothetical protein n=1 Tax=Marinobacter alexandrii TaxID=2570351 RepID=UPI002ABDE4AE|nr:hypothetical protein [Marinobacter alexandrii]
MSDLSRWIESPWFSIAAKAAQLKKGKPLDPLTKEEIAQAIESASEPPPDIVKPLIAQMLRDEFKLQKGVKPRRYAIRRNAAMHFIELLEAMKKSQCAENQPAKRGGLTLRDSALSLVAQAYFVTTRTLENWIEEHEKITLEAYRRSGKEFPSFADALAFEHDLETKAKYSALLQGWPRPPMK